jgi:hypothetical protein
MFCGESQVQYLLFDIISQHTLLPVHQPFVCRGCVVPTVCYVVFFMIWYKLVLFLSTYQVRCDFTHVFAGTNEMPSGFNLLSAVQNMDEAVDNKNILGPLILSYHLPTSNTLEHSEQHSPMDKKKKDELQTDPLQSNIQKSRNRVLGCRSTMACWSPCLDDLCLLLLCWCELNETVLLASQSNSSNSYLRENRLKFRFSWKNYTIVY